MSTLTLLGRDFDGYRHAIDAQQDAWQAGSVAGDWREFADLERAVLSGAACTDGSCDLIMVPADWVPALARAAAILPIELTEAAWSRSFLDGVRYDGRYWGLPYHDGPQLLFWRTDLYDDEGERQRYQAAHGHPLRPPRTWAELEDQARWFTRPKDELWGTVLAGKPDGHNNVYDFVAQLWRRGGGLFDENGRAAFHDRAGVDAALWLRSTFAEAVSPSAHDLDSVQSGEEFASGRVAVAVTWAGFAAMATAPGSAVRGRFRCALAPAGAPTVNAFWVVAIAAGSRTAGAALDFVRHLSTPEMDRLTTLGGASGARLSSWCDPEILERYPEQALFADAHANSRPLPRVPQLPAVVAMLNEAVDDIVHEGADAEATLAQAATRVDVLVTRNLS